MSKPSAESLSIASVSIPTRPEPPVDLTDFEKEIWRSVTNTKPPEWFQPDTFPLLRAYCRAASVYEQISEKVVFLDIKFCDDDKLIRGWIDSQEKQARLIATLATKMRLTQQSRYTPMASQTANKKAVPGKKPWE
jgi:hypothetical protein